MDWRDRCWSSDLMIATSKSMDSALPLMSTKLTRTSLNYSKESSVKPDNDKDTFFIWYRPATFNACRMKTRPDGFWRPTNQIFDFKPFIFPLKNNKFWSAWRLEPINSHKLNWQPLTIYTSFAGCQLKFMAIFLFIC